MRPRGVVECSHRTMSPHSRPGLSATAHSNTACSLFTETRGDAWVLPQASLHHSDPLGFPTYIVDHSYLSGGNAPYKARTKLYYSNCIISLLFHFGYCISAFGISAFGRRLYFDGGVLQFGFGGGRRWRPRLAWPRKRVKRTRLPEGSQKNCRSNSRYAQRDDLRLYLEPKWLR